MEEPIGRIFMDEVIHNVNLILNALKYVDIQTCQINLCI